MTFYRFHTPAALAFLAFQLLASPQASAAEKEACYQDACAKISVPECPPAGEPLTISFSGKLLNPHSMSVTTYQLLANAEWRYTDTHQVQRLAGDALASNGFLFNSQFDETIQTTRTDIETLTLVFGPRSGGHGFYDVAIDLPVKSGQSGSVQIDIKPGTCPNPVNVDKRGVTPVSVVGSPTLNVREIDLHSITLVGVAPSRYSYGDVTRPSTGCTTADGDGITDLNLKFSTQELTAAAEQQLGRPLFDGEMVTLPFKASLKGASQCGGELSGEDTIQVIRSNGR